MNGLHLCEIDPPTLRYGTDLQYGMNDNDGRVRCMVRINNTEFVTRPYDSLSCVVAIHYQLSIVNY
jgi:hypothetical protein